MHDVLFQPIDLGAVHCPNRILMAPLTRCRAEDGHVPGALMATQRLRQRRLSWLRRDYLPYRALWPALVLYSLTLFASIWWIRQGIESLPLRGLVAVLPVLPIAWMMYAALRYLRAHPGLLTVNLGTGRPVSVLEMVRAFERASGRAVPYRIVARRPGDVAQCWADPALAQQLLGWTAKLGLDQMCEDAWRWQSGVGASLQA